MWAVLSFVITVAIGLVVVLAVGRRGSAQSNSYPWKLYAIRSPETGVVVSLRARLIGSTRLLLWRRVVAYFVVKVGLECARVPHHPHGSLG